MFLFPLFAWGQMEQHRWEDRVILLFAPEEKEAIYQEQVKHLQADRAGLADRDLVVYSIFKADGFSPNETHLAKAKIEHLRKRYEIKEGEFAILLIGKDGGEKLRNYAFTPRNDLYRLIDAMPMRRAEMRRGGN